MKADELAGSGCNGKNSNTNVDMLGVALITRFTFEVPFQYNTCSWRTVSRMKVGVNTAPI